jgi:predicted dehydrogenase
MNPSHSLRSGPLPLSRRQFLRGSAAVGAGLSLASVAGPLCLAGPQTAPSRRLLVGVMGVSAKGRGSELARGFASLPGVEVAYVCDVDERNVAKAVDEVGKKQDRPPKGVGDFHRILDDKDVDALVIATPDHWHAPATILACAAGKHVYVEKPACHNPREGEWMVESARKHKRIVQLGTQRRSWPALIEAIDALHAGEIGRVISAKCYYFNGRPTIGHGKEMAEPQWLDYSLWQGPAPERPYRDNILPYNWHWFWHWGTGEMGNNAVHFLDVARWGMELDCPKRVTSAGGKFRYDDDQETPDTNVVTYEFGDKLLTFEQRSWSARTPLDPEEDIIFIGEKGSLTISGPGYAIYDAEGKLKTKQTADGGNNVHLQNFVDAIRDGKKQNAPIDQGGKSTLLCHLANISWRVGRAIHMDAGRIADDEQAATLWGREYRKGWEPAV